MSRLYYGFDTNLNESDDENVTPYPDYIAFDNKEKQLHISVSCNGDHDWGVGKDKVLSGRFKGLEVAITDYEDNEIHEYDDMTDEDFELLKGSSPYEVGLYFATPTAYKEDFIPVLKNLRVTIMDGDEEIEFESKTINVVAYGD